MPHSPKTRNLASFCHCGTFCTVALSALWHFLHCPTLPLSGFADHVRFCQVLPSPVRHWPILRDLAWSRPTVPVPVWRYPVFPAWRCPVWPCSILPFSSRQVCARLMSRWVNFNSTLTQMSRVRVQSAVKINDMSRVRVESRWSSFESELSQLDTGWVKVESLIFLNRKRQYFTFICSLIEKEPAYSYIRPYPPPPPSTTFAKLGKMWWVVSQIWLNSFSNKLSQSWVRLLNLGFELSSELSQVSKFGIWVESELSHPDCHLSQSRVSPTK